MRIRKTEGEEIGRESNADLRADFWGPASNFGIPIAAIADMSKDPEMYVHNHTTASTTMHSTTDLLYFPNFPTSFYTIPETPPSSTSSY